MTDTAATLEAKFPTTLQGLALALVTASLIPAWWTGVQYWGALLVHNPFAGLFGVVNFTACAVSGVLGLVAGLVGTLAKTPSRQLRWVWSAVAVGQVPTAILIFHWFF